MLGLKSGGSIAVLEQILDTRHRDHMRYARPTAGVVLRDAVRFGRASDNTSSTRIRRLSMAKKFFYVCAGMLLIAASFALGARQSVAQSGVGPVHVGRISCAVIGRTVFAALSDFREGRGASLTIPYVIPGSSPVVDVRVDEWNGWPAYSAWVALENGDVYQCAASTPWILVANLSGGSPVPTQRISWGATKVHALRP